MSRTRPSELVTRIVESLRQGPKSIREIADDIGASWKPTQNYLETLKSADIITEEPDGKKRVFKLIIDKRSDTYFGLPLSETDEVLIDALFYRIKKDWKIIAGRDPGKVQVQKTLAHINGDCDLNLPIGWYQYGQLCVKVYDPEKEYKEKPLDEKVDFCLKQTVEKYAKIQTANRLMNEQYKEENKTLYIAKEAIIFHLNNDFVNNPEVITPHLTYFLSKLPKIKDEESKILINEFFSLSFHLSKSLTEKEFIRNRHYLILAFASLWKLVALCQYYDDLRSFYTEDILQKHFQLDQIMQKQEVITALSRLNDLLPVEKDSKDDNDKNLMKHYGSGKKKSGKRLNDTPLELLREFDLN